MAGPSGPSAEPVFLRGHTEIDGVTLFRVVGGTGPTLVLLHGWPQSWYEFAAVMPALAREFTVLAMDLPGLGESTGAPPSYDKRTLARFVRALVAEHQPAGPVHLVGHDMGAGVAFAYAAAHPQEVAALTLMDFVPPGRGLDLASLRRLSWHYGFHALPELPEQLVTGREETYFRWFFDRFAAAPGRFRPEAVAEFVRAYRRPEQLAAGFDLYRSFDQDERDNLATPPVELPVQVLSAGAGPTAVPPEGTLPFWRPHLGGPVEAHLVPDAGHWMVEENPDYVVQRVSDFHRRHG